MLMFSSFRNESEIVVGHIALILFTIILNLIRCWEISTHLLVCHGKWIWLEFLNENTKARKREWFTNYFDEWDKGGDATVVNAFFDGQRAWPWQRSMSMKLCNVVHPMQTHLPSWLWHFCQKYKTHLIGYQPWNWWCAEWAAKRNRRYKRDDNSIAFYVCVPSQVWEYNNDSIRLTIAHGSWMVGSMESSAMESSIRKNSHRGYSSLSL